MHLITLKLKGKEIPEALPPGLLPTDLPPLSVEVSACYAVRCWGVGHVTALFAHLKKSAAKYREMFKKFDSGGTGKLSASKVHAVLSKAQVSSQVLW